MSGRFPRLTPRPNQMLLVAGLSCAACSTESSGSPTQTHSTSSTRGGAAADGGSTDSESSDGAAATASAGGASGGITQQSSASGGAGSTLAGAPGQNDSTSTGSPSDPVSESELTVFYLDVAGSVMATDVGMPRARTVVADAGRGPDGIAVDLERRHIYWTGMGAPAEDDGFLRRSDLDGSNVVTIVPEGGTYTPKQLRIDQDNQKLYWSDREGMRVQRANLDGSELETLVTVATGNQARQDASNWCVGIALDIDNGWFYWSQKGSDNEGVGSLRRARIEMPEGENSANRGDIEVLFAGLPEPIDIDLDLENQYIYWTDRGDDTINRAPIEIPPGQTAQNRGDREILVEGVREAIGVTLDAERGHLYFTGGTLGRVGRANLDGSDVVDLLTGTAGLTGIVVVELPSGGSFL